MQTSTIGCTERMVAQRKECGVASRSDVGVVRMGVIRMCPNPSKESGKASTSKKVPTVRLCDEGSGCWSWNVDS